VTIDEEPFVPPRRTSAARFAARTLLAQLRPAIGALIALTLLTGCLFPLVLFALARGISPDQAAGSLVVREGAVVGSRLIGQAFTRADYFHPRPSAAGNGYDASSSGATNYGPSNPKQVDAVRKAAADYRTQNALPGGAEVPVDAVTSSGSGLDPQISPQNAALQVPRVARARRLAEADVRRLVAEHVEDRQFGFMGAPRVSVLELNLALDRAGPGKAG